MWSKHGVVRVDGDSVGHVEDALGAGAFDVDEPDERRTPAKARMAIVDLNRSTVARLTLEPVALAGIHPPDRRHGQLPSPITSAC
jgi:hypothetical protein